MADPPKYEGVTVLDEAMAESFIAHARWTFAKTMPQWPHEYTVRDQNDTKEFEDFVQYIKHAGVYCKKTNWTRIYLDIGDWYYWTMGSTVKRTRIINRARCDEGTPAFKTGLGDG